MAMMVPSGMAMASATASTTAIARLTGQLLSSASINRDCRCSSQPKPNRKRRAEPSGTYLGR